MKKTILIAMLAILLITVSACDQNKEPAGGETYIGGNEGLKMTFAPDAPPLTTADNKQQSFDVGVQIENRGEYEVSSDDIRITVEGFSPEAFGVTKADLNDVPLNDNVIERRIRTPDGVIIEPPYVEAVVSDLEYQQAAPGNLNFPIRAQACYLYETDAISKLCIKEDLLKQDDEDLCKINAVRELSTSGAPVQITNLQQSGAGRDKTRFTFTIANQDTGRIYKENSECEPQSSIENKVWVEIEDLEGAEVDCTGLQDGSTKREGYVSMSGGTPRDVTCTAKFDEGQRTNRVESFNIKLRYNYREYIDTGIEVQYTPED